MAAKKYSPAVREELKRIAHRVRRERIYARLSRKELASRAGIAASTIDAYEQGRSAPPLPALLTLAEAFGVPPGIFFKD